MLIYFVQQHYLKTKHVQHLVPVEIKVQLTNYDISVPHTVIGGRVRSFPVSFLYNENIPIVPQGQFVKLIYITTTTSFIKMLTQ